MVKQIKEIFDMFNFSVKIFIRLLFIAIIVFLIENGSVSMNFLYIIFGILSVVISPFILYYFDKQFFLDIIGKFNCDLCYDPPILLLMALYIVMVFFAWPICLIVILCIDIYRLCVKDPEVKKFISCLIAYMINSISRFFINGFKIIDIILEKDKKED